MTSWQVKLATALAWLGVLPGIGCLYLAFRVFETDPGFLFVILPIVFGALLMAGLFILSGAVNLAVRLGRGSPGVRLHAFLAGAFTAFTGLFLLRASPVVALLLILYGGTLAGLMATSAAEQDLGPWIAPKLKPQAPWGQTPNTGIWAPATPAPGQHPSVPAGPVQGPWAPDPTTLPWLSWKNHSGPRAPWWQTWQAGLAQGIPLWELVLLCAALLGFLAGLVGILLSVGGSAAFSTLHLRGGRAGWLLPLLPVSLLVVVWLEQRMRTRLARR